MLRAKGESLLAALRLAEVNCSGAATDAHTTDPYELLLESSEDGPTVKQLTAELKVERYRCQGLQQQVVKLSAFYERSSQQLREAVASILGWRCGRRQPISHALLGDPKKQAVHGCDCQWRTPRNVFGPSIQNSREVLSDISTGIDRMVQGLSWQRYAHIVAKG
jgi:hypothetical protein